MSKIVLIDGHSILNRAFYGVPDLTNSAGTHVNAIYGFLNIMFMILEEEKPEYLTVAFDVHAPTFRHELFADYKGTRSPMAPELREQVPLIQEVLKSMNINVQMLPGYEADDVLGTIAKECQSQGLEVSLVSGDRDLLQISDEHIRIRIPKTKGGKTTIENYYPGDVVNEYGVTPAVFIDMKALMGDSSDNVHGVAGVGPKSAEKLLKEYGSLDGIYEHVDEMKKSAVKENLIRDKEQAYLARKLVTICIEAPVDFKLEDALIGDFYNPVSYELFKKLEFKNYLSRFESGSTGDSTDIEAGFNTITDLPEAESFFADLKKTITETALKAPADAASVSLAVYMPLGKCAERLSTVSVCIGDDKVTTIACGGMIVSYDLINRVKDILSMPAVKLITFDSKNIYELLDIDGLEDRTFDMTIAAYLCDPLRGKYDAEYVSSRYLDKMIPDFSSITGCKTGFEGAYDADPDAVIRFSAFCAHTAYAAYDRLSEAVEKAGMMKLFTEIEMPLSRVLASMEHAGIRVRRDKLKDFSQTLGEGMKDLEQKIYDEAGEEFNILSPKQLGVILFEKMGLKGGKKTKTGYSTSADVLEKMTDVPIVSDILKYRGLSKLKSTYADGLAEFIDEDERIRSSFHQTVTATGRISSSDPNMQNIPTRTELGRELRRAFIPSEGCVFADADYSQIELRILAHMAGDEDLIASYREGADIHRITASKVFGVPAEEVDDLLRRRAKAVNFGIVYGISSYGLSEDIGVSRKEAEEYIRSYFATFPGIKKYLDGCVESARETGVVSTLYGRIRPIPDLTSSNFMQRQFGERVAMNSPIQGTAADIMKIAMIRVWKRLREEGLRSKIVLQIHDELLIDTYEDEKICVCDILKNEMEKAADLKVDLIADLHTGNDWYEAK
ncbi:MAG: DNA polymerase I [Lachnospiraceae bacterium]|nr:DNA polymerase I [Lachnospiraceae bacterium]